MIESREQMSLRVGSHMDSRESSSVSISKVGAVCGNAARTDLCGERPAMGVPTAKSSVREITVPDDIHGQQLVRIRGIESCFAASLTPNTGAISGHRR